MRPAQSVGAGEAARIMTGAPVSDGADAVVMVEYSEVVEGDGGEGSIVALSVEPAEGEHIRRRGEEVHAGDVVLEQGEVIGPAGIGLLASTGHSAVRVVRRPRVAVISTGSELVEVAEKPGPGKIRNSNSYSIAAQVIAAGGIPVRYPIVPDDMDATREAFRTASHDADFIVTSGGVSVGDFDYVKPVLEELGELTFCKVAMRPGNPQTLGIDRRRAVLRPAGQSHQHVRGLRDVRAPGAAAHAGVLGARPAARHGPADARREEEAAPTVLPARPPRAHGRRLRGQRSRAASPRHC